MRLLREKRAILFDLGTLTGLPDGLVVKVTDVFVTHTHIDHFIGFDHLLRNMLGSQSPLRIYGPENIIECVAGKLKGYAWNLIENYPLNIEAYGISKDRVRHVSFRAKDRFEPVEDPAQKPFQGIVLENDYFKVKAIVLEHDIESIGWSLEEDFHINIDKSALTAMGVDTGPWLTDFKKKIRAGWPEDSVFIIPAGRNPKIEIAFGELKRRIAMITRGQKVTYVMDSSPTPDNIRKITEFASGTDTLYLEAYFLDEDMERAIERNHLTAGIAGRIAREAGAKNLHIMHYSPKYRHNAEAIAREASEAFGARVHEASPYGQESF